MTARLLRNILFFLTAATFAMPLLVFPQEFIFPFIVPKVVFLRTVVLLMLATYILLLLHNYKQYAVRLTAITWTVLLFFLSMTLSTFIGVDWYKSFWDNHERMLGLFTMFHYIVFYVVLTHAGFSKQEWRKLVSTFLVGGSIVMVVALWQRVVNPEFLFNRGSGRVASTLGNAIYVSGYGLFLLYLGIISFIKARKEGAAIEKSIAGIAALLGFVGIFLGGTRGTLVGLIVGIALAVLFYALFSQSKKIKKLGILLVILGLISGGILFAFRATPAVQNIPGIGRLVNTSLEAGTASTRFMAWGIAIEAWQAAPVFGWGPNNYFYAFNELYRPAFLQHGFGETWFDNAHNAFLNTLAVQGILGAALYVGLFLVPLWVLFQGYRKNKISEHVMAVTLAFFAAHFTHNFFVFENPTSYLFFFFTLALMHTWMSEKTEHALGHDRVRLSLTTGITTVALLLIIFITNINVARANMATLDGLRLFANTGQLETVQQAFRIPSPHVDDMRADVARAVLQDATRVLSAQQPLKQEPVLYALEELNKNYSLHPRDIRVYIQNAQLLQLLATVTQNAMPLTEAEKRLEAALEYSPKRQQILYNLSTVKLQLGKGEDALALLQQTINDDPSIDEGWWRTALILFDSGQVEPARAVIAEAQSQGVVFKAQGQAAIEQIMEGAVETAS